MPDANPSCVVCLHSTAKRDPFYYLWRGRRFDLFRCPHCTHQFLHPPVTRVDQNAIYDDVYFSDGGDWACGTFGGGYVEAEDELREEAREVLAMLPSPPGRLLDIGCAGGVFLDEARSIGWDAEGVEINAAMAAHAQEVYNVDVLIGRIEDVPRDEWREAFDVVTLMDVLEHVPEPARVVGKVAGWLKPGGVLLIRGPIQHDRMQQAKEWMRRVFALDKQLDGYPLDANVFNLRSLAALCDTCGLEPERWVRQTWEFANLIARRS